MKTESWDEKAARLGLTNEQGIDNAISMIRAHAIKHNISRDALLRYYDIGRFSAQRLVDLKREDHGADTTPG